MATLQTTRSRRSSAQAARQQAALEQDQYARALRMWEAAPAWRPRWWTVGRAITETEAWLQSADAQAGSPRTYMVAGVPFVTRDPAPWVRDTLELLRTSPNPHTRRSAANVLWGMVGRQNVLAECGALGSSSERSTEGACGSLDGMGG